MNERIKELRKQAIDFCLDRGSQGNLSEEVSAKLAELIVRECIKESMDEIVADEEIAKEKDPLIREYLRGNNQGVVDAVVRFRNHFGVEE